VALLPATENMPSGSALKPGDVLKTMSGQTIEIMNTDAEGRLILADAIAYACRYKPGVIVDIATLTGACVGALSTRLSGAVTNRLDYVPQIIAAGYESGERVAFGRADAPAVPLSEAVMASCAIPGWFSPVTIQGRRYIDGGAHSATNVDLVAGAGLDEVYVLAPMVSFALDDPESVVARLERRWRVQVTKRCLTEVEQVRGAGADVVVLGPGPADLRHMGGNAMDVSQRLAVLRSSLETSVRALSDPEQIPGPGFADAG
jgi:predicted acylesterase/phospholipase RssA